MGILLVSISDFFREERGVPGEFELVQLDCIEGSPRANVKFF